ncbi:MAG: type II secretion system F family protein [Sporomusaceae bacterium]|nr:type II secretion system F family protein [Sporomusaceae bacterium]
MAQTFIYKGRNWQGKVVSGRVVAESREAAAKFVRQQGYFVTTLRRSKSRILLCLQRQSVSRKELAFFCRQFFTMLEAGVSLLAALQILWEQGVSEKFTEVLEVIYKEVQEGQPLWQAFERQTGVFPRSFVATIKAGELGGILESVLCSLAQQLEKECELQETLQGAFLYPLIVLAMTGLSVSFILVVVMPNFVAVFSDMHVALPLLTRVLLAFSAFLREWGLETVAVTGGSGMIAYCFFRNSSPNFILYQIAVKMPFVRSLWRKAAIAQSARLLATLLASGISLMDALILVEDSTNHPEIRLLLQKAKQQVKAGGSLTDLLRRQVFFSPLLIQFVTIGEETGELDAMLLKIAQICEGEVTVTVRKFSVLLEPCLIIVVGLIVALFALAIMIPLFDVISGMNQL